MSSPSPKRRPGPEPRLSHLASPNSTPALGCYPARAHRKPGELAEMLDDSESRGGTLVVMAY